MSGHSDNGHSTSISTISYGLNSRAFTASLPFDTAATVKPSFFKKAHGHTLIGFVVFHQQNAGRFTRPRRHLLTHGMARGDRTGGIYSAVTEISEQRGHY